MLFDLQSRRRRTAVKIIYLLLAVLMASGLVLFGVGTGSGNGGFLNSLTGNGSGGKSAQNSEVDKALRAAERKVAAEPNSASAWQALMLARYDVAGSGNDYDQTTNTFTAAGKAELTQVIAAWNRYTALVKGAPDENTTLLAARAFSTTGDYAGATVAWQDFIAAQPGVAKGYTCLALTAYAAKKTALGNQAAARAVKLAPKLNQIELKTQFSTLASDQSQAKTAAASSC